MKTSAWVILLGAVFLTGTFTSAFGFALFHSGSLKAFAREWRIAIGPCCAAGFVIALLFWLVMRKKI